MAILGFDMTTEVVAGENRGRTLTHDFVVLALARTDIEKNGSLYETEFALPQHDWHAPVLALAAWVGERARVKPIQAVGGWLTEIENN